MGEWVTPFAVRGENWLLSTVRTEDICLALLTVRGKFGRGGEGWLVTEDAHFRRRYN